MYSQGRGRSVARYDAVVFDLWGTLADELTGAEKVGMTAVLIRGALRSCERLAPELGRRRHLGDP